MYINYPGNTHNEKRTCLVTYLVRIGFLPTPQCILYNKCDLLNRNHLDCCPWSHGLWPKKLSVSVAVPPAPVQVPNRRPLAQSVASVTLVANDKDIMKWSWDCAQISWHLPYSWGIPQKTSARRSSDEGVVQPVIASNGVPFLQMRSVGSHSTSGWEMEGKKERTNSLPVLISLFLFAYFLLVLLKTTCYFKPAVHLYELSPFLDHVLHLLHNNRNVLNIYFLFEKLHHMPSSILHLVTFY